MIFGDGIKKVIETYYNCIRDNKMKLEEVPERYRKQVEAYCSEMEKKNANS